MKFTARIPVTVGLLMLLASTVGCSKLKARDQLNKGIAAFKDGQYEAAVNHFQNSVRLDPTYENGQLYLATSYAYQVVPNLTDQKNLDTAQKAIDGFQAVLAKDPSDLTALKQIASLYRNIKRYKEAKEYELRVIAQDPGDAEAHYIIGVVDWIEAYKNANAVGTFNTDGVLVNGNSKDVCANIKSENAALVDDGMQHLQKAIDINPTYDDAMSYLQLTYRRKTDVDCGNAPAIKADVVQADEWVKKGMGARKQNELKKEQKVGGGVQM